METKDYKEKELEKLSRIIPAILKDKEEEKYTEIIAFINDFLKKQYHFDSDTLIGNEQFDIVRYLYDQKKLTSAQIETIAELIYQKGMMFELQEAHKLAAFFYTPALALLEFLKLRSNTVSIESDVRILFIKNKLQIN